MTADKEERICVGAIAGAFGVQGEVRLKSFCAEPTAIAEYGLLYTEDGSRSFKVRLTRPLSGGLGARLSGVATKEEADALKGTNLYADKSRLPKLPDDEYYYADLIGLEVRDPGGAVIGKVAAVHSLWRSREDWKAMSRHPSIVIRMEPIMAIATFEPHLYEPGEVIE